MKVIIIGAGVSGLAAAVGLVAAGHTVEVYERADRLRTGGNGVLIWHNGTGILRDLGIPLDGLGHRIDTADVWAYDGVPLMRTDLSEIARHFGSHGIGVMRGQVIERLADALPADVLHPGMECADISYRTSGLRSGKAVTVTFTDGTVTEGDVLIGADGYRSVVRTHLFGEDHARYTGLASWHGTTTAPLDLGSDHCVPTFYGKRGLCTIHPVGDGLIHWSFEMPFDNGRTFVPRPGPWAEPASRTVGSSSGDGRTSRLDVLHDWFGSWTSPVRDLLDVLTEDDIAVAPHTMHKVHKWWGRGPVTLVGDAAHAIPPRAGWGVNQALEDGWVLSRALGAGSDGDQDRALRAYESTRRGRARKVRGRAKMLRHGNSMLLMLRFTKDGLPSTKMLQANIKNCSNYLNQEFPGGSGGRGDRSMSPAGV
ncbi:NAD(P)/FAD-dependent oxidoreductase [Streptomyces sp. NPDC007851]|uniref:NAD(P)/FAD-dependent oxidoreductase n=1 Tax=Streptomyces sp. NPDC007851 TaxID=3155008 RepID=UPI0033E8388A